MSVEREAGNVVVTDSAGREYLARASTSVNFQMLEENDYQKGDDQFGPPVVRHRLPELPTHWTLEDGYEELRSALDGDVRAQRMIAEVCLQVTSLLLGKNRRYGNSALEPLAVFARDLSPTQRMGVRMDDKLSRIARGSGEQDAEDPRVDLVGYLILALVSEWS